MRKLTILMSTLVFGAMLLSACGGAVTATSAPATELPTLTEQPMTDTPAVPPEMTNQVPSGTETVSPTEATTPGVPVTGSQDPARLSNELGFNVVNQNGDQLGEVNDMVIDLESTSVTYVIVDTSSSSGASGKTVLVPWDILDLQTGSATGGTIAFVFQGDQATFDNAPDTDVQATIPQIGQSAIGWDIDIQNYWQGTGSTITSTANKTIVPEMTATENPSTNPTATGVVSSSGENTLQGVILASRLLTSNVSLGALGQLGVQLNPNATAMPAGTTTPNANQNNNQLLSVNIDDAIINIDTGSVQFVVINATFDNVEHLIPVPLNVLSWEQDAQTFVLNHDITTLQDAPFFQNSTYPDTRGSDWASQFLDYWNNK